MRARAPARSPPGASAHVSQRRGRERRPGPRGVQAGSGVLHRRGHARTAGPRRAGGDRHGARLRAARRRAHRETRGVQRAGIPERASGPEPGRSGCRSHRERIGAGREERDAVARRHVRGPRSRPRRGPDRHPHLRRSRDRLSRRGGRFSRRGGPCASPGEAACGAGRYARGGEAGTDAARWTHGRHRRGSEHWQINAVEPVERSRRGDSHRRAGGRPGTP